MAKRYGRNQRRKARERIARLEDRLFWESTADLYVSRLDRPDVEQIWVVESFQETEIGGPGRLIERELELTVLAADLDHLYFKGTAGAVFQFRGRSYMMKGAPTIDIPLHLGSGSARTQLSLVGVADE